MDRFYLGTHMPHWLHGLRDVPLFVSHRRLRNRRVLQPATTPWALDSGGYSELYLHGQWQTSPEEYVDAVRRYDEEIGSLEWAAPQDWMCEPWILAKTGQSVAQHQVNSLDNFLELMTLWGERHSDVSFPFVPVLQGRDAADYLGHLRMYEDAGVPMREFPVIGIGSICRRAKDQEIYDVVWELAEMDVPLHGFGVKGSGVRRFGELLISADSMAWSFGGRRKPGCSPTHSSEANCLNYALAWRDRVLAATQPKEEAA